MPAIKSHSTATSAAAWDGPANETKVQTGKDLAYFSRIYAWRDPAKDESLKGTYRFIHHFVAADGTPGAASIRGCQTGIGVLNGGMAGTTIPSGDRQGVWTHLAKHLEDAGLTAPALKSLDEVGKIWEEKPSEFRFRLRDPAGFEPTSMRRIPMQRASPKMFGIAGKLKGQTAMILQALRFPKSEGWTSDSAHKWVTDHPDVGKADVTVNVKFVDTLDKREVTRRVRLIHGRTADGKRSVAYVLFDRSKWDKASASKWLTDHGYKADKVSETETLLRYVQDDSKAYVRYSHSYARGGNLHTAAMKTDDLPDLTIEFSMEKAAGDQQNVFGWASVSEVNGKPLLDKQKDIIPPAEGEKAAYDYVLKSRVGGEMHMGSKEGSTKKVGTMIESMYFSKEKQAKLGIDLGKVGWWVGFHVNDKAVWAKVKDGTYKMFSIFGGSQRVPVTEGGGGD